MSCNVTRNIHFCPSWSPPISGTHCSWLVQKLDIVRECCTHNQRNAVLKTKKKLTKTISTPLSSYQNAILGTPSPFEGYFCQWKSQLLNFFLCMKAVKTRWIKAHTVRICYSVGLWFSKVYHYIRCIITSDAQSLGSYPELLFTAWNYPWKIDKIPFSMGCRVVSEHFSL